MILSRTKRPLGIALLALLSASTPLCAWPSPASIHQQLDALEAKAQGVALYKDKNPIGIVTQLSEQQFTLAEQSFREREFISTVRLLNSVFNQMSSLDRDRYLKANYLLGRSYEELAYPSRAIKAYLRYLSSYATQGGGSDLTLIEVMRRLLLLDESMPVVQKEALQRLMANLMSLQLSPELKAQVTLLASVAAYHAERHQLAADWLSTLRSADIAPAVRAEANFYLALNNLALGKDQDGENLLLDIFALNDPSFLFIRDLSALNLARLYGARQMPQNSWEWFQKVEGPGPSIRFASYEGILLLLQNKEYAKALQLAQTYVIKYPHSPEAYRLQERLSFLQFQSGHLDPAEADLRSREIALKDLERNILASYRGKDSINAEDVAQLRAKTEVYALQSSVLEQSDKLFKRIQSASQRLAEQRQELSSTIYTLGRVLDASLRPEVLSTDRQFRELTSDLFALGDALLGNETDLYGKQLTPSEQQSLSRSAQRRQRLQSIDHELIKSDWRQWDRFSRIQLKLDQTLAKISRQRSSLQAIILAGRQSSSSPMQKDLASRAENLLLRIQAQEEIATQQMEQTRLSMLTFIRMPSPYQVTRKKLLLGSQEYLENVIVFDKYRDNYQNPMNQHQQEDIERAWLRWQKMAGKILSLIKSDEASQAQWLDSQLQDIRSLLAKERDLSERNARLRIRLGEKTAIALPAVLDHFDFHISEQKARGKKWLADLQWQRFMSQTEERLKKRLDQEQKETQIEENRKDLEIERSIHE